MSKPNVVFVLGGPGVGKGTQCAKLVSTHEFMHLSAGDLLRAERNAGGEKADLINSYIVAGKIVPVEITVNLVKDAMKKAGWEGKRFLIDGFPRNTDNYDGWNTVMGEDVNTSKCVFFEADEQTLIDRIMERAKTSGRKDDNMESLIKRLKTFNGESVPVVEMFEKTMPGFVVRINALQSIDKVFSDIEDSLKLKELPLTAEDRPVLYAWQDAVSKHHAWFEIQKIQQRQQIANLKASRWTNWRDPVQWAPRYQAIDNLDARQQLGSISKSELAEVQGLNSSSRFFMNSEPAGITSFQLLPMAAAAAVGFGTGGYMKFVKGQNILWFGAAFLPLAITGTVMYNRQDEIAKANAYRFIIAKRAATAEHEGKAQTMAATSEQYKMLADQLKSSHKTLYDAEQSLVSRISNGKF